MSVNREKYLKETPSLEDIKVVLDESGDEVSTKKIHIVITDADTGKMLDECDSSSAFICAVDSKKEGEVHNLVFSASSLMDVVFLARSIENGLDVLKNNHPVLEFVMGLEELLHGKDEVGNDD